jgi:hypothetical protein
MVRNSRWPTGPMIRRNRWVGKIFSERTQRGEGGKINFRPVRAMSRAAEQPSYNPLFSYHLFLDGHFGVVQMDMSSIRLSEQNKNEHLARDFALMLPPEGHLVPTTPIIFVAVVEGKETTRNRSAPSNHHD